MSLICDKLNIQVDGAVLAGPSEVNPFAMRVGRCGVDFIIKFIYQIVCNDCWGCLVRSDVIVQQEWDTQGGWDTAVTTPMSGVGYVWGMRTLRCCFAICAVSLAVNIVCMSTV